MVWEASKTFSMWLKSVVQAWVPRFDGVERPVEVCCFDANFADKVFGEMGAEGGWVGRGRRWEERVVDKHADGVFAVHGCCCVIWRSLSFTVAEARFAGREVCRGAREEARVDVLSWSPADCAFEGRAWKNSGKWVVAECDRLTRHLSLTYSLLRSRPVCVLTSGVTAVSKVPTF